MDSASDEYATGCLRKAVKKGKLKISFLTKGFLCNNLIGFWKDIFSQIKEQIFLKFIYSFLSLQKPLDQWAAASKYPSSGEPWPM